MFKKGNKLHSVVHHKCPRCHEGKMFKSSLLEMKGIYNMHDNCTECGQDFQMEPGFYWGAMYIGYMLSSAYMLTSTFFYILMFGWSIGLSFTIMIIGGIIILPVIARLARVIWINIYVGYKPKQLSKNKSKA